MLKKRKGIIWLAALLIAFAAVLYVAVQLDDTPDEPTRGVSSQNVGQLKRVSYQGEIYREKPAMTAMLLIGTDRPAGTASYGARQGGQADFLMLAVVDHNEKIIHRLQIDRDTMTAVETLGVLGNPVGTKEMQICLACSFGVTPQENCKSVQTAVENLLEGIEIDYYLAMGMDSIGRLNDALGGVTVTLQDDMSDLDAQMVQGETLTLNAEQAELMVRGRMQVGDGTNKSRMRRQRVFLESAGHLIKERIKAEPEFADHFLDEMENDVTMNITRAQLLRELNTAHSYELGDIQTISGQYIVGGDGFMEFHASPGAAVQWVLDVFYTKEDGQNNIF